MKMTKDTLANVAFLVTFVAAQSTRAGVKEGDLNVGATADGQLSAVFSFDELLPLPPVDGFLQGWASDEPGFFSIEAPIPSVNLFPLKKGALVELEVVSFDPALQAWLPGFSSTLRNPGNTWLVGTAQFDAHLFWHVDSTAPEFDPATDVFTATFLLRDVGTTGYAASDPFTLSFTPVPEPTTVLLLGMGGLGLIGARRSINARGGSGS